MKKFFYMSSLFLLIILGSVSVRSTMKSTSLANKVKDLESEVANSVILIDELEDSVYNLTNVNNELLDKLNTYSDQLKQSDTTIAELEEELTGLNIVLKDISPLSISERYLMGLWSAKPLDQDEVSFADKGNFSNEKLINLSPYISDQLKQVYYNISIGVGIYEFAEAMNREIKPSKIEVTLRTEYENRIAYDYILYFDNLQDQDNNKVVNFTGSLVTIKDGDRWVVDTDNTLTVFGQMSSYMTRQGITW
ncbi:coiled-coil domain-containing protein [Vallitalea okinawensis]|uniref:hypothetical protein n=1 Tax=Vallitalea okinawensis TaxID=2078660 RepID=UPI000CFBB9EF|nr:hypothetical protein [Vallitalea okinawensis]